MLLLSDCDYDFFPNNFQLKNNHMFLTIIDFFFFFFFVNIDNSGLFKCYFSFFVSMFDSCATFDAKHKNLNLIQGCMERVKYMVKCKNYSDRAVFSVTNPDPTQFPCTVIFSVHLAIGVGLLCLTWPS